MDPALVALELKHEEKIFGGRVSTRQLSYLACGFGVGLLMGGGIAFLFKSVPFLAVLFGLVFFVPAVLVAAMFAFLPAGYFRWLPGPQERVSDNPFEPPIRLDEWLLILWRHREKRKHLPWGSS